MKGLTMKPIKKMNRDELKRALYLKRCSMYPTPSHKYRFMAGVDKCKDEYYKLTGRELTMEYGYDSLSLKNKHSKIREMYKRYGESIKERNRNGGGFDHNKPAILYYLKVTGDNGEVAYKIGITNRTVQQRFCADDLSKIEVITTTEYKIGRNAHKEEQRILNEFKELKWNGEKLLKSGNTELFSRDVLGLDK